MILRRLIMAAATIAAGTILSKLVAKATQWNSPETRDADLKNADRNRGAGGGDYGRSRVTPLRNAPRRGQRDRNWSQVDEASDESFPASDPPARY